MNRRHFLLNAASGLPCCLLPGDFIRRAAAAFEAGDTAAALAAPTRAAQTLYAIDTGDCFLLALDSAKTSPEPITWRKWADLNCFDIENPGDLEVFAIEQEILSENCGSARLVVDPESEAPPQAQAQYLEWDWSTTDSPAAQAYHYLADLGLGNSEHREGATLGNLILCEGEMPGSNWTGARTDSRLVLPALQRRLLELGEDVRIEVEAR